jgi:spore coat protein CotH
MKKLLIAFALLSIWGSCADVEFVKKELNHSLSKQFLDTSVVPAALAEDSWTSVFNPAQVLELHLRMQRNDWDIIRKDATNSIEVPAWFKADGETEIQVSVRRKSSRALPSEEDPWKIGMKIGVSKLVDGQRWHGLNKLSLENGSDIGPVAEGLAWNMHELASVNGFYGSQEHAGLAAWVKVSVTLEGENAEPETRYLGVYINVEQRDKQFLKNRNWYTSGATWLYEVDDIMQYLLEVGEPHSPAYEALNFSPFRLVTTKVGKKITTIPTPADPELKTILDSRINMQAMLTQAAIDAFTTNGDALFTHGKNFKIVDFSSTNKRTYLPWDLDAVFGATNVGIYGNIGLKNKVTQTEYQRIILNHPYYREQYNAIILGLLQGPLAPRRVDALLDQWKEVVQPALDADPYENMLPHKGFDELRQWNYTRATNVINQVNKNNLPAPRPKY